MEIAQSGADQVLSGGNQTKEAVNVELLPSEVA